MCTPGCLPGILMPALNEKHEELKKRCWNQGSRVLMDRSMNSRVALASVRHLWHQWGASLQLAVNQQAMGACRLRLLSKFQELETKLSNAGGSPNPAIDGTSTPGGTWPKLPHKNASPTPSNRHTPFSSFDPYSSSPASTSEFDRPPDQGILTFNTPSAQVARSEVVDFAKELIRVCGITSFAINIEPAGVANQFVVR